MGSIKQIVCICLIWSLCFFLPPMMTTAEECSSIRLYADGNGAFYALRSAGAMNTVECYRRSSRQTVGTPEAANAFGLVTDGNEVFLISRHSGQFCLYAPKSRETALFGTVCPTEDQIVITPDRIVYLTENGKDTTIFRYTNLCENESAVTSPYKIIRLFLSESGNACALTEKGLFLPETGAFISCDVPAMPFSLNQGFCGDRNGNLFRFDEQNGFQKLLQTDNAPLFHAEGALYSYQKDRVIRMDMQGNVDGYFETGDDPILSFAVSGDDAALICKEECRILHPSDFVPVTSSEPSTEPSHVSSEPSIPASKPSDTSLPTTDSPSPSSVTEVPTDGHFYLKSSSYHIEGDLISNIPIGTTAAVLKKGLDHPDCALSFTDHNGKSFLYGTLGTGACLCFSNDRETKRYYTIVKGDLSGEGSVNTLDLNTAAKYLVKKQELSDYALFAGDLDNDGKLTVKDLCRLQSAYYRYGKTLPKDIFCHN